MLIFLSKEADYSEMGLSPEQIQERMGKWFAWDAKMEAQGVSRESNALLPEMRRISGPNRTVSDQASAELKELVGGYYIVKAKDFDHAIEIAQDFPDYDLGGTVEIREVMVFDQP
ncbi:MAG: YciI family protein [Bacteroidota bacterium]